MTPLHTIIKMPQIKNKEKNFKDAREKFQVTFEGKLIKITTDFL